MYSVQKSIDVDFAHHVGGHPGACINVHGHTWKFEVCLQAPSLNETGFVVDFGDLKRKVLQPVHTLLDHSLALYDVRADQAEAAITLLGKTLMATREPRLQAFTMNDGLPGQPGLGYATLHPGQLLNGARNDVVGGMKLARFPFSPTSELLAKWLFDLAAQAVADDRVSVRWARIYETLHPVEAVAEYRRA